LEQLRNAGRCALSEGWGRRSAKFRLTLRVSNCRLHRRRRRRLSLDSWAGQIKIEWDPQAPLTPLGQASFFIEFLKVSGAFDALVADCPLYRTSPNAPSNRDVLSTLVLSVLAGHKRYAHVTALRADAVLPELLGIERILSEDAVRRGLAAIEEEAGTAWLRRHLDRCTEPLLGEGWVLDPTPPSSRSTAIRKAPCSATTPRSPAAPATPTTPSSCPACAWCWMWT
jgi:hypothetical protein